MRTPPTELTPRERLDAVVDRLHAQAFGETLKERDARLDRERRRSSLVVLKGGRDDG
jgi:hypothetical protein